MPDNSSDSEKNFDISDQASTSHDPKNLPETFLNFGEDFGDESDDDVTGPGQVSDRLRNGSDWAAKSGSFDVDQLHQLRELYQTRHHQQVREDDEDQEYLDAFKERNTDELETLRKATAVLERFENQPYVEEPVAAGASAAQRRIRPQRFVAGAARYANKLLMPSRSTEEGEDEEMEEDEGIAEVKEEEEDQEKLVDALGGEAQVEKHKRISREVAKLRFSNPGTAFIDHFNLDDEGGASLGPEFGQRATRRAKADASDRLRTSTTTTQSKARMERIQEQQVQRQIRVKPSIYHNELGQLVVNEEVVGDLCDCLGDSCPGCFFGCPECGSNKCGPVCRSRRQQFAYCIAEQKQKGIQVQRYNPYRGAIRKESPAKVLSPEKGV